MGCRSAGREGGVEVSGYVFTSRILLFIDHCSKKIKHEKKMGKKERGESSGVHFLVAKIKEAERAREERTAI